MRHTRLSHRRWLAAIMGTLIAGSPLLAGDPEAKKMLFQPVDVEKAELNPKQALILDRIKSAKETVGEVQVLTVKAGLKDADAAPLFIPLPHQKDLELGTYQIRTDPYSGATTLTCKEKNHSVQLTRTDDSWEGLIYARDRVYYVQPLGKGLQAISRVDQSKMTDEPHVNKQ